LTGAIATCATVTGTLALARPAVTEMVALPFATATTVAFAPPLTEATAGEDDVTVGVALGIAAPFWSYTVTLNDCVAPSASSVMLDTDAVSVVATGGGVESLPHPAPRSTSTTARRANRAASP
jgi:hypothetical protein